MQILSVNVARVVQVEINGSSVSTGIYKEPVAGEVWLRELGFEGDEQADLTVHGGTYQAAYCYPSEHYGHWQNRLNRSDPLPFGTFGENLTSVGLLETEVFVGDIYRFGSALVQVTAPRLPCMKFAHKIGRPDLLKEFLHSGYSGLYLRVLEEGGVSAGDEIKLVERDSRRISVRTLLGLQKLSEGDDNVLRVALSIPALAPGARRALEARAAGV